MSSDGSARTPDDDLDRLMRGAVPGEFSFFGRQKEQQPPPLTGIEPGRVIDDFKLIAPIGQGGMGQVWEAEQLSLNRRVALKLVRPDRVNEHTLDLFSREARAGGRLHHSGIVTVHGYGEAEGVAWISMELVEGAWTLKDFIEETARAGELPERYYKAVAELVAELADALQAAHESNVIHRDLKPGNVLITPDEHPKVTDFGLARITDETALSVTGDVAGTYAYMSPEQVAANRIGLDHRTDIFSLGVVLYELLVLRRPFVGDTSQQVGRQILLEDPVDPRKLRSKVPQDLAVISGKCMQKHPDRRYPSMADLAADIRRHLANEPILAKPPTAWQKTVKWVQRHPTPSVAAAVGVVAFVVISALLAENIQTNEHLRTEVASVKRLSALQDYEDLVAQADGLGFWPAYPEHIRNYKKWIEDAQALVDELPLHHARRDELRERARTQTDEERKAERRSHPDYPDLAALDAELASKGAALRQRRNGKQIELPDLNWEDLPHSAPGLRELAGPLVKPDREEFGREAEGYVLASRALELAYEAQDDKQVAMAGDTLSRALFALGRDEEALEASQGAMEVAPEEDEEEYSRQFADLERWVKEASSREGLAKTEEDLKRLEIERGRVESRVSERREWRFPDSEREAHWWHNQLTKLIQELEALRDEETGLLGDGTSPQHGPGVRRRLREAERLRDGFGSGGEFGMLWDEHLPAIGRAYPGLKLVPQMGLVPIGPDPESGFWEFSHLLTGEPAVRGRDDKLLLNEETGVVLVLLPAATFWMGAQGSDPDGRNFDRGAQRNELPVRTVKLSAFFISKFELTQTQWERLTGQNPSYYDFEKGSYPEVTRSHPVERVSFVDCVKWLPRMGLSLPTEAQWEYGARAGTETPWWTGTERESLEAAEAANLADQAAARVGARWAEIRDWPELDDGYAAHAPIGTYAANPFGLHEVTGNVWEWCLDGVGGGSPADSPQENPVGEDGGSGTRVVRGGGFHSSANTARSAHRSNRPASGAGDNIGVRPARAIDR